MFWFVFVFSVLFCNEYNLQWLAAVVVGKYSLIGGFKDAYQFFSFDSYAFFTAMRLPPFLVLAIMVFLTRKKDSSVVHGITWGGLIGVVGTIVIVEWSIVKTYYMNIHVPSTSAIGLLVVPILAIPSCLVGGLIGRITYWICCHK